MCSVLKLCMFFCIYMYTLFSNNFYRCAIMSYVYFCTVILWRIKILYPGGYSPQMLVGMCRDKMKNGQGLRNGPPVERENVGLRNELDPF